MFKIDNFYTAIDCADPLSLADFYAAITQFQVFISDDLNKDEVTWVELRDKDNQTKLAFQKIANYRQPTWPDGNTPQQAHLDFFVDDLDEAENHVLALGAKKADFQPGSPVGPEEIYEFRVYLDLAGHPFCLIRNQN